MSTSTRLAELHKLRDLLHAQPHSCDTCRFWFGYPVIGCDEAGNELDRTEPEQCPDCGRDIPVRHALRLIGISNAEIDGEPT